MKIKSFKQLSKYSKEKEENDELVLVNDENEDEFYEGSFQFDKNVDENKNESVENIDNFTAQYYDNYDDEEEDLDYEVDFQNNSDENIKRIQMFENFK